MSPPKYRPGKEELILYVWIHVAKNSLVSISAHCSWPVEDVLQSQLESLSLASVHKHSGLRSLRERRRRVEVGARGGGLFIYGDERPQRVASSALRDRYLATASHAAKAIGPVLVSFFFSLTQ